MTSKRLVRIADFTAEVLDEEASRMPLSYKDQADLLRKMAENFRRSENPRKIWVCEDEAAGDLGEI